jgi:hypothetical protein
VIASCVFESRLVISDNIIVHTHERG